MKSEFNRIIKVIKGMFTLTEIAFSFLFYFVINFAYQYLISESVALALMMAVFGGAICFYSITVLNRKVNKYQSQLLELNKYASSTVFKLKSGMNIADAIYSVKDTVGDPIREDVEITLDYLNENQDISTENFKKYHFYAIDIFHQILTISYFFGGDAGELFNRPLKDMAFEIKHRDKLQRNKDYIAMQIYMMMLMVLSIPMILRFLVEDLYAAFLSSGFGVLVAFAFHLIVLINLFFLQREKCDISIR